MLLNPLGDNRKQKHDRPKEKKETQQKWKTNTACMSHEELMCIMSVHWVQMWLNNLLLQCVRVCVCLCYNILSVPWVLHSVMQHYSHQGTAMGGGFKKKRDNQKT